jgi:hypothetical protein
MPPLEDDLLEMESKKGEEPCRKRWIWFVYLLLFVFSVPWYLPGDTSTLIWWGLPAWVVISYDWHCTFYSVRHWEILASGRRTPR